MLVISKTHRNEQASQLLFLSKTSAIYLDLRHTSTEMEGFQNLNLGQLRDIMFYLRFVFPHLFFFPFLEKPNYHPTNMHQQMST